LIVLRLFIIILSTNEKESTREKFFAFWSLAKQLGVTPVSASKSTPEVVSCATSKQLHAAARHLLCAFIALLDRF